MISPQRLLRLLAVAAAIALVFVAGCGSVARTQGSVSYDGQPVDQGGIVFIPEGNGDATPPVRVTGAIQDGRYELDGRRAPSPGKYRIQITWQKKTGKKVTGEGGRSREETEQVIPAKYNTQSELIVEVQPGSNTFDFPLKK